jgi:hypothetical protein
MRRHELPLEKPLDGELAQLEILQLKFPLLMFGARSMRIVRGSTPSFCSSFGW